MIGSRLTAAVALLVVFTAIAVANAKEKKSDQPSLLVFLADDVDWKDFGCYGNDSVRTPNIDALASGGLRFTHAFLTTSSCSPTRISVLTGKYPHATGAEDLHMPLPADQTFVSTHLRKAGYFTGHMRKTHYGPNGMKQFDWYSKSLDFDKFLDECGERPFFMWVGFSDAHRPYKKGALDPPHDPKTVKVPPYLADTAETRADLAMYYDEIGRMDQNIGRMMGELKRRGRLDNTLVVFFSDNGMPFPRAKGTLYDSGIGTPLVMQWPKVIGKGRVQKELASVIDLAPTLLEAASITKPKEMQGRSLMPVLQKPGQAGRDAVFSERNWHNCDHHMRSVRTARYKLIRNAYLDVPFGHPSDCSRCPSWQSLLELKKQDKLTTQQQLIFATPRPRYELYDLQSDPWEFRNLADSPKHSDVVKELTERLDAWAHQTGDCPSSKRRRADNTNRVTGVKFTRKIPKMTDLE